MRSGPVFVCVDQWHWSFGWANVLIAENSASKPVPMSGVRRRFAPYVSLGELRLTIATGASRLACTLVLGCLGAVVAYACHERRCGLGSPHGVQRQMLPDSFRPRRGPVGPPPRPSCGGSVNMRIPAPEGTSGAYS